MVRCSSLFERSSIFVTPFKLRKGIPPAEPDFVLEFADGNTITFLEITKATHPADQRELTEFERSGKSAMRPGDFGGRFSRGVSQPGKVRKGIPPAEPDFVLEFADGNTITFLEITKATHPADQRELTEFERSGKSAMRPGDFGGRFSRGVSQPGKAWASDVLDAIKRKAGKAIFCMSDDDANRHLVINPESNASFLLFYDNAEIDAFRFLNEVVGMERGLYIKAVNGCLVHVLGKEYVCFDLLGEARLIKREVSDLSI